MEEILKEIMIDILEIKQSEITDEFNPDDTLTWDSLNNFRIITAIEEEFEIELTMNEIEKMVNFKTIVEVVRNKTEG